MHPPSPENGKGVALVKADAPEKLSTNNTGNLQHPGVSIKEASAYFSCHEKTIRRWIAAGKLKVNRLPSGRARIILEAIK